MSDLEKVSKEFILHWIDDDCDWEAMAGELEALIQDQVNKARKPLREALENISTHTEHEEDVDLGYCRTCKFVDEALANDTKEYGEL